MKMPPGSIHSPSEHTGLSILGLGVGIGVVSVACAVGGGLEGLTKVLNPNGPTPDRTSKPPVASASPFPKHSTGGNKSGSTPKSKPSAGATGDALTRLLAFSRALANDNKAIDVSYKGLPVKVLSGPEAADEEKKLANKVMLVTTGRAATDACMALPAPGVVEGNPTLARTTATYLVDAVDGKSIKEGDGTIAPAGLAVRAGEGCETLILDAIAANPHEQFPFPVQG